MDFERIKGWLRSDHGADAVVEHHVHGDDDFTDGTYDNARGSGELKPLSKDTGVGVELTDYRGAFLDQRPVFAGDA